MGLSWGSPNKGNNTNSGGGGRGDQSYAKQKREAAARKKAATPKAKKPNQNNKPKPKPKPKYDQKYWADKNSSSTSQASMKAEQNAIGMKKAYSGDRVITNDMKRQASDDLNRITGSMATLQNGGVTKTAGKKYGLLSERQDTTYNYKGGPSIVTRSNDPVLPGQGLRLGDKTSTTFVNGVEVATKIGNDKLGRDAKVTRPNGLAKGIDDSVEAAPDAIAEMKDLDNQIKTETDPAKLKALHQRRLALMRLNRTNTRFAGLLEDPDINRTNLMSIS